MPVNLNSVTAIKHERFLSRFVVRGWLHATRDEPTEQEAVDFGLRRGWLKRDLSEVKFTRKGRKALGCH